MSKQSFRIKSRTYDPDTHQHVMADFDVEVDLQMFVDERGYKARSSKGKKTTDAGGAIVAYYIEDVKL